LGSVKQSLPHADRITLALDQCAREHDSYCFDESCGVELYEDDVGVPCECTEDNIGAKFSSCVNNRRQLFYYWKPPATCLNGTLPQPVDGIPCSIKCSPGEYLDVSGTPQCSACPTGTSSYGWGHVWDEWIDWPAQFTTKCAIGDPTKTCNGWTLDGETINSGDNHENHYMQSSLTLNIKLAMSGWFSYSYMVSAEERYDGLYIVIDDLIHNFVSNTNGQFLTANYSLSAGQHTISWQYYKDRSMSRGLDKVIIDWIQVMGTTWGFAKCEECPLGHYQNHTGSSTCYPCDAGTYAPTVGLGQCLFCEAGKTSYPGASSCFLQQQCADLNPAYYTFDYSPCSDGQRIKTYRWIEPISCLNPNSSSLPAPVLESCAPNACRPGQYVTDTNECEYCPPGTSSPGGSARNCSICVWGYAATNRTLYMDSWESWPQDPSASFTTGCIGTSCYGGWRLASQYIDSGLGHGQDAMPWVEMSITGYNDGRLSVDYSLMCEVGNEAVLSIDGIVLRTFQCAGDCQGLNRTTLTLPLRAFDTSETHTWKLRFTYIKSTSSVTTCDRFVIHNMTAIGLVNVGGSPDCFKCRNGTYTNVFGQDHCTVCNAGTSSLPDADICLPCEDGYFADQAGMSCLACGAQTFPNEGRTMCDLNCSHIAFVTAATNETRIYDLTMIGQYNKTIDIVRNGTINSFDVLGSICDWHPRCIDASGNPLDSYLCYETEFGWRNMGKVMAITELVNSTGLVLSYTEGLQFPFGFRAGLKCSSQLTLRCDPSVDVEGPMLDPSFNASTIDATCHIKLLMRSRFACLKCTEDDLDVHVTDCKDGQQTKFYAFRRLCSGGMALPEPEIVECSPEVVVKSNTVIILIVVIIIFFLGVVGGFGFLVFRNRQLYEKYTQLANRDVPMEEDVQSGGVRLETE